MAEFEELRLTVNLVDNASAGLSRIRTEIGALTQVTTRMTAGLAGASTGVTNLGGVMQRNAPAMRSLRTEVTALNRSAENLGRGLIEMATAFTQGRAALPQLAEGLFTSVSAVRSLGLGLRVLAPAAAGVGLAIAGLGTAVVLGAAAFVTYSIFAFRFAKEMDGLARTGKALGSSFGDVRNMQNVARQYGMASETLINNLAGLQKAQVDLHQNGSRLRADLLSKGMDPKWISDIQRETEGWKASNMVREKGLQIEKELIAKGWNPRAARGMINELAQMMGMDKGIFDRKPMRPLDPRVEAELGRIEVLSRDISEAWGRIGDQIESMKLELLSAGLPVVKGILKWFDEKIDAIKRMYDDFIEWYSPRSETNKRLKEERDKELAAPPKMGPYGPRQRGFTLPHLQRQSFTGGNDNNPLLHRASFTTERLVEDTEENTSQLEKLTSQLEKINAYFDYSRSVGGGTGSGGAGAGAGRGGGAAGARGGGAGARGGGGAHDHGTGSGGNVQMSGGEKLASGYFAPITSSKAGGGLGGTSASMGAGAHGGDDLMAPHGSPVHAIKDGKIERYGRDNQGGMTMTVRHSDGTSSTYMHLSKRISPVGSAVKGGETIGASGTANGVPHLHFEMRDAKGQRVSPRDTLGVTRAAREAEAAKQKQEPPKPVEPEKKSDAGGADSAPYAAAARPLSRNGELANFDPSTGEKIDRGMIGGSGPSPYDAFRRSENIEDWRETQRGNSGGRGKLSNLLGAHWTKRPEIASWREDWGNTTPDVAPNLLNKALGYDSIPNAPPGEYKPKRLSMEHVLNSLDRGALNENSASGSLKVNVTAPPGTEVNASGGGLFKNPTTERSTEIPYNGPSTASTARQYMGGQ